MPCYHPLHVFKAPGGGISFSRAGGYSDQPLTLACGQCRGCRLERSRQWAVRCMHEAQMHERNCFVTLTYDEEHIPQNGSLKVKDWQDFAKRTRRKLGRFRFYHCGEYGDENGRPHYHAALFGLDFMHDRKLYKTTRQGNALYESATLAELWPAGLHTIGELTFQSAAYVARYIMKKVNGDLAEDHYARIDTKTGEVYQLKPEYTTMSRRPGIGATWINKFMSDVYPSDEVIVNGHSTNPPKFYDTQFEKSDPKGYRRLKVLREKKGEKHQDNNTWERLAIREEVSKARTKTLTRKI